jgi:hypothetical protein
VLAGSGLDAVVRVGEAIPEGFGGKKFAWWKGERDQTGDRLVVEVDERSGALPALFHVGQGSRN